MGAQGFAVEGPGPGPAMRKRLAGFVVTLRDAGFVIGRAETQDAARLVASPMAERPERLRAAMRTLFASRRSELVRFDELFDAFWRACAVKSAVRINAEALAARSPRRFQHGPGANDSTTGTDPARRRRLHPRALQPMAAGEHGGGVSAGRDVQEGHRNFRGGKGARPSRGARRTLRAGDAGEAHPARARRRRGRRLDLRATIRLSIGHGGEPFDLKFRRRKLEPLRLVILARRLRLDGNSTSSSSCASCTPSLSPSRVRGVPVSYATRACLPALKRAQPCARARPACPDGAGVGGGTEIGECLAAFGRSTRDASSTRAPA